ncbi:indolepyruvate oxidoreductase subunit beta [Candidatus Bathyarchaeota archaeon A05DMB-2]|nr:indolepyruvate oxidoreductase subunit beta [Candidatus Bathyarchaeota archaeon A05DMB-2]
MSLNIFICGVGGQGLVLLTTVVGNACAKIGMKVVTGEMYGLSQRSGAVSVHLRIGEDVFSPLIPYGEADILLSLESIETLRYVEYLKKDGVVLMNKRIMHPPVETSKIITSKGAKYLTVEDVVSKLKSWTPNIAVVDALRLAKESGNVRTENTVFLGCLSALEAFPVDENAIRESIEEAVPKKTLEQNLKAFDLGKKSAHDSLCTLVQCRQPP